MVVFPFVGDTVDTVFSSLHPVPSGLPRPQKWKGADDKRPFFAERNKGSGA